MLNKDYNNQIISEEIKKLFADLDKVVETKNRFIDELKKSYLNLSTNN